MPYISKNWLLLFRTAKLIITSHYLSFKNLENLLSLQKFSVFSLTSLFLLCAFELTLAAKYQSVDEIISEFVSKKETKQPVDYYKPVIASMSDIVNSKVKSTEFFQLLTNPAIFVMDFANLEEQGKTMNRLSLLVEVSHAPKNRVVDDIQMASLVNETSQNMATLNLGHDFRMSAVARFFNLAKVDGVHLNSNELKLKNTLLKNNLMYVINGQYRGAFYTSLVTTSKIQADNPETIPDETISLKMRQYIVQHELSHGEYFTNKNYNQYSRNFWHNNLTNEQKEAIRMYLDNKYYDKTQEDLMINEFQAYLVYTGIEFCDLFHKGKISNMSVERLIQLRKQFIANSNSSLPLLY